MSENDVSVAPVTEALLADLDADNLTDEQRQLLATVLEESKALVAKLAAGGIEAVLLTADTAKRRCSIVGSPKAHNFLNQKRALQSDFLNYCDKSTPVSQQLESPAKNEDEISQLKSVVQRVPSQDQTKSDASDSVSAAQGTEKVTEEHLPNSNSHEQDKLNDISMTDDFEDSVSDTEQLTVEGKKIKPEASNKQTISLKHSPKISSLELKLERIDVEIAKQNLNRIASPEKRQRKKPKRFLDDSDDEKSKAPSPQKYGIGVLSQCVDGSSKKEEKKKTGRGRKSKSMSIDIEEQTTEGNDENENKSEAFEDESSVQKRRGQPKKSVGKGYDEDPDFVVDSEKSPKKQIGKPKNSLKKIASRENESKGGETEKRTRGRPRKQTNIKSGEKVNNFQNDEEKEEVKSGQEIKCRGRLKKQTVHNDVEKRDGDNSQDDETNTEAQEKKTRGRLKKQIVERNIEKGDGDNLEKKGRGRPRKSSVIVSRDEENDTTEKRGQRKPQKNLEDIKTASAEETDTPKRGRGRPRKSEVCNEEVALVEAEAPKRGRGRPRKSEVHEKKDALELRVEKVEQKPQEVRTSAKRSSDKEVSSPSRKHSKTFKEIFTCVYCEKEFVLQCLLQRHLRIHQDGVKPIKEDPELSEKIEIKEIVMSENGLVYMEQRTCNTCSQVFKNRSICKRHELSHENVRPFTCNLCKTSFSRKHDLKRHLFRMHRKVKEEPKEVFQDKVDTEAMPESITVIGTLTEVEEVLQAAVGMVEQAESSVKPVEYSLKDTQQITAEYIENIKKDQNENAEDPVPFEEDFEEEGDHDQKPFQCNICKKVLGRKDTLKDHMKIHTDPQPFCCHVCGQGFRREKSLDKHVREHMGEDFVCTICMKTFKERCRLRLHMYTHNENKPFTCETCGKGFALKATYLSHQMIHDGIKPFKCDECNVCFRQRGHLGRHRRTHTDEKPFACETCFKGFKDATDLKKHYSVHSDQKPHMCDICGKCFKLKLYLKKHMSVHNPNKASTRCEVCAKFIADKYQLAKHMLIHNGYKPYSCGECGKTFRQSGHLKRHTQETHSDIRGFECHLCGKKVKSKGTLKKHLFLHDLKSGKLTDDVLYNVKCPDCDRKFLTVSKMMRHRKVHTGEKPFSCDRCGKKFGEKKTLEVHYRLHTGEKPYACTFCERKFAQYSHLKRHLKIHNEERPFECTVCGKKWHEKGDLKKHMRIHVGLPRNHVCEQCGKGFTTPGVLKIHYRSHTGERPYGCQICGRAYTQKVTLEQHMTGHTGERKYPCRVCNKGFTSSNKLKTHMMSHTGVKPYICEVCGRGFVMRWLLKKHMKFHTNQCDYTCDICGIGFVEKRRLRRHMKNHELKSDPDYEGSNMNLITHTVITQRSAMGQPIIRVIQKEEFDQSEYEEIATEVVQEAPHIIITEGESFVQTMAAHTTEDAISTATASIMDDQTQQVIIDSTDPAIVEAAQQLMSGETEHVILDAAQQEAFGIDMTDENGDQVIYVVIRDGNEAIVQALTSQTE